MWSDFYDHLQSGTHTPSPLASLVSWILAFVLLSAPAYVLFAIAEAVWSS